MELAVRAPSDRDVRQYELHELVAFEKGCLDVLFDLRTGLLTL